MRNILILTTFCLLGLTGCRPADDAEPTGRHYGVDYNFVVSADSLVLREERPMHTLVEPLGDSLTVRRGERLVVAQLETIPEDAEDSVWVKVARDQMTQGWVHESVLLRSVTPDDPISQTIALGRRDGGARRWALWGTVGGTIIVLAALMRRRRLRPGERLGGARLPHVRDIPSPYPTLLCLAVAATAVAAESLRLVLPDLWAQYYFHPTLNPFGQPAALALVLGLAWLTVVLLVAAADEVRRCLPPRDVALYAVALLTLVVGLALLFTLAARHFLGVPLLVLYGLAALRGWWVGLRRGA